MAVVGSTAGSSAAAPPRQYDSGYTGKKDAHARLGMWTKDDYDSFYCQVDNWNQNMWYPRPYMKDGVPLKGQKFTYRFYDTPDDQDTLQKLWYMTKVGAIVGWFNGYMASRFIMRSKPSLISRLIIIGKHVRTGVLCGALYTGTVCGLALYRGEQRAEHHFLGGLATVAITYPHWQVWQPCVALGVFLGTLAWNKKRYQMNDWGASLADPQKVSRGMLHRDNTRLIHDFTLSQGYQYEHDETDPERRKIFKVEHYHNADPLYVTVRGKVREGWRPKGEEVENDIVS